MIDRTGISFATGKEYTWHIFLWKDIKLRGIK